MGNFFRSLFGPKKSNSKIKPRMQSRRLALIGLEERITPATISVVNNQVVIQLVNNEDITNLNTSVNGAQITINTVGSQTNAGSGTGLTVNADSIVVNTGTGGLTGFAGISVIGFDDTTDFNSVTIGATGIDLSNAPGGADQAVSINLTQGSNDVDVLNVNGVIKAKGTGGVTLNASAGTSSMTIATAGGITTTDGAVNISSVNLTSSGDITTSSGNISFGSALNLGGNIAINSTSGNLSMGIVTAGAKNLTINQGSGTVALNNVVNITTGNLSITTTNATANAIKLQNTVAAGNIILNSAGDITAANTITAASVNAKSTAGDVIFNNTVTTTQVGGFTSEATSATKATKIAAAVTVGAGASAVVTGNLISNNSTLASITTQNVGNITITGNVDASVAGNGLTLSAATGAITIGGNVGSSSTAMGDLTADGSGIFLASGTVVANDIKIGQITRFATSVTFAKAVVTTGANKIIVDTSNAGTITFSESITSTNATGVIDLQTVNGNLTVIGAINTKHQVEIDSAAGVVVLSGNITNDGTTIPSAQAGVFISVGSGSLTTSGTITSVGTTVPINFSGRGGIQIQSYLSNSSVTINGALSTTGGGAIRLQAGTGSGINQMSVNAPVTTSGATAGEIIVYANGGSVTLNQPVTLGTGGKILLSTGLSTDTITINSGAAISAGTDIYDTDFLARGYLSAGKINLAANLTTTLGKIDLEPVGGITLSGPVSMKAQGTTVGDIILGSINGAQNLTLEATDQIHFKNSVGQAVALNTLTVTNSRLVLFDGDLTAANVILTNTATTIFFKGNTNITSSLTTTANAYDIEFGNGLSDNTVLAGAPVFLNTGNVVFFGTTTLTSGATITGGSLANVNLAGTIISDGAFNIDAGLSNINVTNNTQLILNSTTAASTFASPLNLNAGGAGSFNLLGVGTLNLTANSTAGVTTGDTINVTNGTLNATGTLGSASTITLTNGTLTGPGGTVGNLTPAIGTVDPEGTLNTGVVTFNAATTYIADVLTTTTASNLTGNAGFSLGGATLSLSSVASGLGVGNSFTIINNTAVSGGLSGTFAGLPEGAPLSALDSLGNTITFAISYVGGIIGANDVTLTVTNVLIANPSAIPQPMVAGQPQLNFFTAEGAGAGGGPMVTVTIDIIPGLTTVPTYFSFFAYDVGFTGGVRVAINELDGNDDTFEIITGPGAGGGPNVKVFQFNIRTLTFNPTPVTSFFAFNDPTFNGGVYVAGGDVTGDGIGDLLVGAGAGGGPRVQVYAGSLNGVITSSPISDFFAYSTEFLGGVVVAAGDRTGDTTGEVITGPASNGGYNIKSFNVAGTGNSPTLIENFFAFNDFTSIGGLSIATSIFDSNPMFDLVVGTTNTQFGVILNQDYEGILANPFPGFNGAIRAGFASSGNTESALAAAGPGGGPAISVFSVDPINRTLTQTDSLFVFDPEFTGGLFVAN
ncbi:MAG: S-layer family protein [Planctomycetota bacterium]|nr:MAG: S-layer family protein [Planctomycetota bacterium]